MRWRWLSDPFVAIKINAADLPGKPVSRNELRVTKLITAKDPSHEGWHFVRTLKDSFTLQGRFDDHICLVFQPLREPLWLLKTRFEGNTIPVDLLKIMVQMMLHSLDYLHQRCRIIHIQVGALYSRWIYLIKI